jgi:hypothetical protein
METTMDIDTDTKGRLHALVNELTEGKRRWVFTGLAERATLLRRTHATVAGQAEAWAATACRIKQLPPGSPLAGHPWPERSGPLVHSRRCGD